MPRTKSGIDFAMPAAALLGKDDAAVACFPEQSHRAGDGSLAQA